MSLYAVIKGEVVDGIVISDGPLETDGIWVCVDDVDPQPGPNWSYDGENFAPPPPPPPPPPLPNIITKLAMIDRFTEAEYEGVLTAAKTDVQVQGWLDRFAAANQINLDDSRTVSGIDLLVSKNLLTQERGQEILTNPVQPNERP
jgi:hypothetical protein